MSKCLYCKKSKLNHDMFYECGNENSEFYQEFCVELDKKEPMHCRYKIKPSLSQNESNQQTILFDEQYRKKLINQMAATILKYSVGNEFEFSEDYDNALDDNTFLEKI